MQTQQPDLFTLARGQDGRPVVIDFAAAIKLRDQIKAKSLSPENVRFADSDDDFPPEAA